MAISMYPKCPTLPVLQIVQKSESLRASCEEANKKCVQQVELYQSGLEAAQEKLKHAISEITRGNEVRCMPVCARHQRAFCFAYKIFSTNFTVFISLSLCVYV